MEIQAILAIFKKTSAPDERFMLTKYRIRLFICLFSGLGILVLLGVLDYLTYKK